MFWLKQNKKSLLIAGIILLVSLPVLLPLFHKGFFLSDDGEWMIIRFSAFYQALRDGQFPVRFLPRLNFEYGYPVANFLYPGFMYLGIPIHILGFGFVDTIKIILGLSMTSSALFCYKWLSKFFNKWASFVGAFVYLYTPYHLYDLYKRGSVGEILALAVLMFVLWQIERKSFFWITVGMGFLLLSHNTLALIFLPVVALYIAFREKMILKIRYFYIFLLSLGVSAFFWIPALYDLRYTVFSQTPVSDFRQYFANMELLGVSTLGIFFLSAGILFAKKISFPHRRLTVLFLCLGTVSAFFSLSISDGLWNIIPVSFIQFPFRLLSVVIVCEAFLLASFLSVFPYRKSIIVGSLFVLLTILGSKHYIAPSLYFDKGEGFYATNEGTTTVKNEYMPIWMENLPLKRASDKIESMNVSVFNARIKSNSLKFGVEDNSQENQEAKVVINSAYFPGWNVRISGSKSVDIVRPGQDGRIELYLPKSRKSEVEVFFGETPFRLFSDFVSIASVVALCFVSYKNRYV